MVSIRIMESWFVPGYENFAVDDKYKDARITIAAAEDPKNSIPLLYTGRGIPIIPVETGYTK